MSEYTVENSQLRLMYEDGEDEKGNMKYRTKSYNNVKVDADSAELLAAANAIGSLQSTPVVSVKRNVLHFLG